MKSKTILYSLALAAVGVLFSCSSEEELSPTSVIAGTTTGGNTVKNDFDNWLEQNYLLPYNIRFKYRYEEIESDLDFYTIPADYKQSIELAHLIKYICIDSYDEVAGIDFTRKTFPKEFFCIGEWKYKNNGTFTLATAAGGKKILLCGVNHLDTFKSSIASLTHYYFKTIHHEFTHILNQTKDIPTSFKFITGSDYVSSAWSDYPNDRGYLSRGFISAYAEEEYTEDFAEMLALYVCYSPEKWEEWMSSEQYYGYAESDESRTEICLGGPEENIVYEEGGTYTSSWSGSSTTYRLTRVGHTNREAIESKLLILRQYMQEVWGIDIDALRDAIQRREREIEQGRIDLNDLTIK